MLHDSVNKSDVAEKNPRLHGVDGVFGDDMGRFDDVYSWQLAGTLKECFHRYGKSGCDSAATILSLAVDEIKGRCCAKINDYQRAFMLFIPGHSVDNPVSADLAGIVVLDRHSRFDTGAHDIGGQIEKIVRNCFHVACQGGYHRRY